VVCKRPSFSKAGILVHVLCGYISDSRCLSDTLSPVDDQSMPSHEGRLVRRDVNSSVRNLIDSPEAGHRNCSSHIFIQLISTTHLNFKSTIKRGVDEPRAKRIEPNAFFGIVGGHLARHGQNRVFSRGIYPRSRTGSNARSAKLVKVC
jgi:hypothetical protein